MTAYTVRFTKTVAERVSILHPEIKKDLRAAIREIGAQPNSGKVLQEELFGFLSYRFKRYRLVSRVDDATRTVTVYMFGHRRDVYELFSELVRQQHP